MRSCVRIVPLLLALTSACESHPIEPVTGPSS
jgi:hypothetical protein